jgi:hypothetical protein
LRARGHGKAGRARKIDCPRVIVKRRRMQIRFLCVAVLVAVLLGTGDRAAAAALEERRLLILEAPGNVLTKSARERLTKAIAEVATRHGLALASAEALPVKLLGCELPGCLSPIAAATGAIFVLRVDAKFAKESFNLVVELWNSDAGKLLGHDRRDCPICDEQDLWGSAALLTQGLLDRALREPPKAATSVVAQPSDPRALRIAQPATSPPATQVEAMQTSPLIEYGGLALCVAGLAGIGVGAYYVSVDGDVVGQQTDEVRDTRKYGLPMTIAGGVALVAGAGLLAWSFWSGPMKLAVGPSGISLAGNF